ncbi:hypothetical protein [Sphingomonas sp. ID0503]|uniref:hypothetical protein n=1 Tax=Sphingomonas sp. ID0503 TaxID=3399691 RepID=UPI003AFA068F
MVPDLDLQLQVVLKALQDTIKPALDPADKPAGEQLGLIMATLGLVRANLPKQRRFVRRLLEKAIALAETLNAGSAEAALAQAIDDARAMLRDPEAEAFEVEACRGALNARLAERIAAAGEGGIAALSADVLSGTRGTVELIRAFNAGSGFEGADSTVPPIDTLLTPARV